MIIPTNLLKRSVFIQQIGSIFETMRVLAPITTIIRATAKAIDTPKLVVTDAKNSQLTCQDPIGTATASNGTINVDSKTSNSVDYCEDDYRDDKVGFKSRTKESLLQSIEVKLNKNMVDALESDSTASVGTEDLSTDVLVNTFLTKVRAIARRNKFNWGLSVDGGSVVKAKYHGKAYVAAADTAFTALEASINTVRFQSTTQANMADEGGLIISPQGVVIIDVNDMPADAKQMYYGVAGAPVHAYREDNIKTWDKAINGRTTASANSGEVAAGDAVVENNFNTGASIWNKAVIPENVQGICFKKLMA